MNIFKCDICGKETKINPKHKIEHEEKVMDVTIKVENKKTGKIEERTIPQKRVVPVMIKKKQQNPMTGEMDVVEVPKIVDLEERTFLVQFYIGEDYIKKDFCNDCLQEIMPEAEALWKKLESIESK